MWLDLGKLIVAKGFKKFPIVQKIAKSGHTADHLNTYKIASIALRLKCIKMLKVLQEVFPQISPPHF